VTKRPTFPVYGTATCKCKSCKIVTKYTGLLYFSNLDPEKMVREAVRQCPTCNARVIPEGD